MKKQMELLDGATLVLSRNQGGMDKKRHLHDNSGMATQSKEGKHNTNSNILNDSRWTK
jgi:hypothetical protein